MTAAPAEPVAWMKGTRICITIESDASMIADGWTPLYACSPTNGWKEVVIEKLVVSHIYQKRHEDDPEAAVNDLLAWEIQVALDPAVSSDARKLVDRGKRERDALRNLARTMYSDAHINSVIEEALK